MICSMPSYLLALDLPQFVTEETLKKIFDPDNSQICEDGIFIKSYQNQSIYKYASIKFKEIDQNTKILNKINNTVQEGFLLQIYTISDCVDIFAKNDQRTIFLKINPNKITTEQIDKIFQKYGQIEQLNLLKNKNHVSLTFSYKEDSLKAMIQYDESSNENILGIFPTIYTLHQKEKNFGIEKFLTISSTKFLERKNYNESSIFVFNLPIFNELNYKSTINESFIRELFLGYEIIPNGILYGERYNLIGQKSAYAIIYFSSKEIAINAIKELNYTALNDIPIRLVLADKETRKILKSNKGKILLKNIPDDIIELQLNEGFSAFGPILECEIIRQGKKSLNYGYIHYMHKRDAEKVCNDLNGASMNGSLIELNLLEKAKKTDLDKQFLYVKNEKRIIQNKENFNISIEICKNQFN